MPIARTPHPWHFDDQAPYCLIRYWCRARYKSGLWSEDAAYQLNVSYTGHPDKVVVAQQLDIPFAANGTAVDCTFGGGVLTLNEGKATGTYTTAVMDAGALITADWMLWLDHYAKRTNWPNDVYEAETRGSEARYTFVDGRDPSPAKPGADFDLLWATWEALGTWEAVEAAGYFMCGRNGNQGQMVRVKAEQRFDVSADASGLWTAYMPMMRTVYRARRVQYRLTLDRVSTDWTVYLGAVIPTVMA